MKDFRIRGLAFFFVVFLGMVLPSGVMGMSAEEQGLPTPLGYVSDYAELLNEEWYQQIRAVCKDLETNTGVEMLVVTLPTIAPMGHAKQYASRLYEAWRVGTAQQQRGILLLVAEQQRQAVVVVGKNLLSVITPPQLDSVSEKYLQPMFRSREHGVNVYRSTVALAAMASAAPPVNVTTQKSKRSAGFWMNLGVVFLMIYALWRFTRPERRHPFPRWKRGEYWGTGQGGFGGNFGGFGGGTRGSGLR